MTKSFHDNRSSKYNTDLLPSHTVSDDSGYEPDVLRQLPARGKRKHTELSSRHKREKSSHETDILRNGSFKRGDSSEDEAASERYRPDNVSRKKIRTHNAYVERVPEDFEDFKNHYVATTYDKNDIQWAEKHSEEIFGKPWDKLTSKDIRREVDNLVRLSQSETLLDDQIKQLQHKQHVAVIAIFDKIKPDDHIKYYAQTERITQNISQE